MRALFGPGHRGVFAAQIEASPEQGVVGLGEPDGRRSLGKVHVDGQRDLAPPGAWGIELNHREGPNAGVRQRWRPLLSPHQGQQVLHRTSQRSPIANNADRTLEKSGDLRHLRDELIIGF